MTKCVCVRYRGRVQGVGFRVTAQQTAARFAVAGFVKNLPDGNVEVLAEGEAEEVERFLAALDQAMQGYIRGRDVQDEPAQGRKDFVITYD